jgi:hypothetical protein
VADSTAASRPAKAQRGTPGPTSSKTTGAQSGRPDGVAPIAAADVDELGRLEAELAPFKAKISRRDAIRKNLREAYSKADALQQFELKGEKFVAIIGPRGNERIINFKELAKKIGIKAYAAFATCTLKALGEHVPEDVASQVVSYEYSGPRDITLVPRAE